MRFSLRVATPQDASKVSGLLQRSYSVLLREAYDADLLAKALPFISVARPELLSSGTYYLVETAAGRIIGAGGWTRQSPTGRTESVNTGNIRHFGTDPEFARQGAGRLLMKTCLQEAAGAGLTALNCYSTLNGAAFYASFGFETIGSFKVELPGSVMFPSVRMVKTLS
ncbi:GNAT family N-acetyltransferase [Roseibium sp.]|uniref:GNAT family N-acetyltransferase n=1 Tax=Roseibium sp. TaxID=1936156 RepID=UPI003D12470A